MSFPIDVNRFIKLDLSLDKRLSNKDRDSLTKNIELMRDAIVATTAFARAKGIGGHTGGPYDIVPEVIVVDALRDGGVPIHDEFFDEAGHRSALQYVRGAIRGKLDSEKLMHYREYCLLYTSPSPRDLSTSRMPSSA